MSLTLNTTAGAGGGGRAPHSIHRATLTSPAFLRSQYPSGSLSLLSARLSHVVGAANKFTPRTGKFDSKNKRNSSSSTTSKDQDVYPGRRTTVDKVEDGGVEMSSNSFADDGFIMPDLPGLEPNFWEGTKWDGLGFFVQYMWAFGIVFAVIACGIAVATYNEGATDFKNTPVYKESVQSRELLEGPDASDSDVFESNPTEEAPSME